MTVFLTHPMRNLTQILRRCMIWMDTGYEYEELYSDVEFEDDTTKPRKRFPMFRKETMSKAFRWTLAMQSDV